MTTALWIIGIVLLLPVGVGVFFAGSFIVSVVVAIIVKLIKFGGKG